MGEAVGVQLRQGELDIAVPVVDALSTVEDPLQPDGGVLGIPLVKLGLELFEGAAVELGADKVKALRRVSRVPFSRARDVGGSCIHSVRGDRLFHLPAIQSLYFASCFIS